MIALRHATERPLRAQSCRSAPPRRSRPRDLSVSQEQVYDFPVHRRNSKPLQAFHRGQIGWDTAPSVSFAPRWSPAKPSSETVWRCHPPAEAPRVDVARGLFYPLGLHSIQLGAKADCCLHIRLGKLQLRSQLRGIVQSTASDSAVVVFIDSNGS